MNYQLEKIKALFPRYQEIKLVYLFGSRTKGKIGPLSDYDFAFYLEGGSREKMAELKLKLYSEITHLLGSDQVDIVILNLTQTPELKYEIIKGGKLIFEKPPFKLLLEPKVLNEYFDFRYLLLKYHLTKP